MTAHYYSPELLAQWFKSSLGKPFIATELALVERAAQRFFGAHCAISSVYDTAALMPQIPCRRIYNVISPSIQLNPGDKPAGKPVVASMGALPFSDSSLDAFVMLHTLDCVMNPHEAIREASRVIRPGGQLVLIGFNPASLLGWARYIPGLRKQIPSEAHFVRRQRLYDWLSLMNFEVEYLGGSNLNPFKKKTFAVPESRRELVQSSFWRAAKVSLGKTLRERFGGVYCLRMRKTYSSGTMVGRAEYQQKSIWAPVGNAAAISREAATARIPTNQSKKTQSNQDDQRF